MESIIKRTFLYLLIGLSVISCSKDDEVKLSSAEFSADVTSISFGEVLVSSSKNYTVTVTNTGEQDLVLESYSLSGNNETEFSLDANIHTIESDKTYEIKVSFNPTSEGIKTATLIIVSNVGEYQINLTGTAKLDPNAIVNIPDANFKTILLAHGTGEIALDDEQLIDLNLDGEIQVSEAQSYNHTIYCSNQQINDLTGIETFINLRGLEAFKNQITQVDLSNNKKLEELNISDNKLTTLDVSNNIDINRIACVRNQLTQLEISNNALLTELLCYENNITELDVSKNLILEQLYCSRNQIDNIDVSKNIELRVLDMNNNQLLTLDVTQNTKLQTLRFSSNQLTNIDIANNPLLAQIECQGNDLTSLDVNDKINLNLLSCGSNNLTNLDVTNNTKLATLYCQFNEITNLDLSTNIELSVFYCYSNKLSSLDISSNIKLRNLAAYNNNLTSLNLANGNNENLEQMNVFGNNLTCIQIDQNFTPPSAGWTKDDIATYSDNCM